jgi:hypothetical protein
LPKHKLATSEAQLLEESLKSDAKPVDIRLRKGEYQYDLAKGIVSFETELKFPDVKDLIKKLYGDEKADDTQFVRNVQTILKKMEKNDVVRILPKKKPWELQRYALSSFKFLDIDKNQVTFATPKQIKQIHDKLNPVLDSQEMPTITPSYINIKILLSIFAIVISHTAVLWSLLQPIINSIIFVPAFCVAFTCSIVLGKLLSKR